MKKLFFLFLLLSLVPFTLGCWGSDDDDAQVTYSNVLLNQKLPANSFAAANVISDITKLTYEIVVGGETIVFTYKSHKVEGTDVIVTFYKPVATTSYSSFVSSFSGKTATEVSVKFSGTKIVTKTNVAMPTVSTTVPTTETPTEVTAVVVSVGDVDLSQITSGLVSTYSVASVFYNTTQIQQSANTNVADVNSTTPTFNVNLNLATGEALPDTLSGITFSVTVKNEATGAEFVLTSTDGLTISKVDADTVSIAINATNSLGKSLVVGTKYSVAITKTSLVINSKYLALPGAYYFTVTQ